MQPDNATAAVTAMIGRKNARGTAAIPQNGDSLSLAPVMVNKGFPLPLAGERACAGVFAGAEFVERSPSPAAQDRHSRSFGSALPRDRHRRVYPFPQAGEIARS